jgi:hypothetical protein
MRRPAAGQGLFEAMVITAVAALLLWSAYELIASRQGVAREPRAASGGTAPSVGPGAAAKRSPLAGAGGAGAVAGLTPAGEGV